MTIFSMLRKSQKSSENPENTGKIWHRKVRKNYDKSIIHLPRQDTNQPLKKPLKSTFFGTQDPSSTPFCTPNFLKSPDVKIHERT